MKEIELYLNEGKKVEFIVTGQSMLPFYKHNKTIVTLKKASTYKKHDVVLFKYNNQYVLHRIIKIKHHTFILKGDGAFNKEHANKEDILGKVIGFTTNGKVVKAYKFKYKIWLLCTPIRRVLLKFIRK